MESCQPIKGLNLDKASQKALQRIREKPQLGKLLGTTLSTGVFSSIFATSKPPVAGYNITQTDWELYAEAMASIPTIVRQTIRKEIKQMFVHYQMPGNFDQKHLRFWRNMKNGCSIQ